MPQVELHAQPTVFEQTDLHALLERNGSDSGPFVSIYIPPTDNLDQADESRIRYKNQLKAVEKALDAGDPDQGQDVSPMIDALRGLAGETDYWHGYRHGFVVFATPGFVRVWRVVGTVPELAVVADSFHIKPLIRLVQAARRLQVFCVSSERVALYEGDWQSLAEVPLHPDVPKNMAEAIGEPSHVTKTRRTRYDQGETDAHDEQLKRYFRRLDQALWEHHSERAKLPLILAALPSYQGFFRQASHNPHLLDAGIERDPFKEMDERQLGELAWQVCQPAVKQQLDALRERYGSASGHAMASDKLKDLGPWSVFGKLETLMIRDDARLGGKLDEGTGEIVEQSMDAPNVDDVLDDLAEKALSTGAQVLVLSPDEMPTNSAVAGICRF
ncbi:MAG: hypothetical protein WD294_12620 [Phycisphaeraceae bacterium]